MAAPKKRSGLALNISYYLLLALLVVIPLIFLQNINNEYELTKAVGLKMIGGLFIISAVIYLTFKLFSLKNKDQFILIDKNIDPAILLFFIAAALSTIFSVNSYVSYHGNYDRQLGLVTYIYVFLIYFFASQILNDSGKITTAFRIMEIVAVIVAAYAVLQALKLDPFGAPIKNSRANSTFGNPVFAGGFLVLVYPFALIEVFKSRRKFLRALSPLLIAAGIIATQTRTAYVAFFVETVIILLIYPGLLKTQKDIYSKLRKNSLIILGAAAVIIILFIAFLPDNVFVKRIIKITELSQSPRWYLWRDSFRAFLKHPALGSGIGNFANVFEYVISPETRKTEVNSYFDNVHNNFLHILCTMGIIGIAAYGIILFQTLKTTIEMMRDKIMDANHKFFALALFGLVCGYVIYGFADFDDLVILLYIFVALAALKVKRSNSDSSKYMPDAGKLLRLRIPIAFFGAALIVYAAYNIYESYNDIKADNYFKKGIDAFYSENINEFVKEFNSAVMLNPGCPDYRFTLAFDVYEYCSGNSSLSPEAKNHLLTQAEAELKRARVNFYSNIQYEALLTMIYFEFGRKDEANALKDIVLADDSTLMSFRNNLARHYLHTGEYEMMNDELNFIYRNDPQSENAGIIELFYYNKINDSEKAKQTCEKILKYHPRNAIARKELIDIENKKKGSP